MKRWLALFLALALLTGCGGSAAEEAPTASPETTAETAPPETTAETTAETASPEAAEPAGEDGGTGEDAVDYQALYEDAMAQLRAARETYDPETVVCVVDGRDVTWEEYFYFMSDWLLTLFGYTGAMPEDYTVPYSDGENLGDVLREAVLNQCKFFTIGQRKAAELGVSTPENSEGFQAVWEQLIGTYGDEKSLLAGLEDAFLSRELYTDLYRSSQDMSAVMEYLYGQAGEKLSEEDVLSWAEDRGFLRVKHILYANFDESGNPLGEDALTEVKARAETSLKELQALKDDVQALEARFDEIMTSDTDDAGGLAQFPEGYTFTEGTMYPEFEEAAFALGEYGLSDIVESQSGYHIILRLPLDPEGLTMDQDANTGGYMTLRSDAANEMFNNQLLDWIEQATVEWTPEFENLDLNQVFGLTPEAEK